MTIQTLTMESSMKERQFGRKARKYLREYTETTGIQGLRYLTEKRSKTEKIFWAVILIISLSGCVFMIYEIVKKYERSPVVVSFATEDTPIYDIPFPAITICPESKYSVDLLNYTDIYIKLVWQNISIHNETELRYFDYINLLCEVDPWTGGLKHVGEDYFETILKLSPKIEMSCWLNNTDYDCQELFTPVIIDQGLCFSFNILDRSQIFSDNVTFYKNFYHVENDSRQFDPESGYSKDADVITYPRRALISGADNSFDIYLKYNTNNTDYLCNAFSQGYRILVHTPWDVPDLSNYYFRVPLDKAVVAAVDPELVVTSEAVKRFNPKKRQCYLTGERPLKYFKMYSQWNCLSECLTNYILEKCGCVWYSMPRHNSTPICGSAMQNCMDAAESELKVKELETKKLGGDYCDCKPQCTALKYRIETSQSEFYWRDYFRVRGLYNKEAINETQYGEEEHWSVLSIYLKGQQVLTRERNELYGVSDLISNFGGLLGLFTGFSLISLAELIYFSTLRIFCNRRLYNDWSGS